MHQREQVAAYVCSLVRMTVRACKKRNEHFIRSCSKKSHATEVDATTPNPSRIVCVDTAATPSISDRVCLTEECGGARGGGERDAHFAIA